MKLPLEYKDPSQRSAISRFRKMPILYLELVENKDKVKSEYYNKPYEPPAEDSIYEQHLDADSSDRQKNPSKDYYPSSSSINRNDFKPSPTTSGVDRYDENEDHHNADDEIDMSRYEDDIVDDIVDDDITPFKPLNPASRSSPEHHSSHRSDMARSDPQRSSHNRSDPHRSSPNRSPQKAPPTLAELQAKDPKNPLMKKDFRFVQDDDDETVKERNEVFFHYEVLKRMHPNVTIPEFTVYSDPKVMAQKYEMLAKRLSLDSNVENWKRYMIIFVMGCEVVLGKLNFDMEGFAQQQIMSMNTYDSLLIEMAEKSYVPKGSKWPVEARLCSMLLMNVVLFVVSKIITKKTGTNLLGSINQLTNPTGEKLMKGPSGISSSTATYPTVSAAEMGYTGPTPTASMATASMATASMATASMATASMATASPSSSVSAPTSSATTSA